MPSAGDKRIKVLNQKKTEIMNVLDDFEEFMTEFDAAIDALQIPSRLEQLEELIVEFTTLRREFNETVDDAEAFEVMQKDRKEFNKRSHEIRAFCLRNSPQAASVGSWNTTHANTTIGAGGSNLRLPKVELPSFDGEVTKWLTFKDRFVAMVHDAAEMPDVVKLQYLLAALKGKVARDFEYVQITAENYRSTWEVLVKRYDNSKTLKREYFKAFYSIERMKTESTDEVSRVVNEARRLVRGLERLGEPVEAWNTPLTSLLFYKLDNQTLVEWERHSVNMETDQYKVLLEFLEQRVNILNSSAQNSSGHEQIMVTGKHIKRDIRRVACPVQQATKTVNGLSVCPLCNDQHAVYMCEQFEKASLSVREELVRKNGLCFNCLRKGHSSRECRSAKLCQKCHRRHHTSLCGMFGRAMAAEEPSQSKVSASAQGTGCMKTVMLATAHVIISDAYGQPCKVRALLDSGSQLNFVTERLAQHLRLPRSKVNEQIAGVDGEVRKLSGSVVGKIRSGTSDYAAQLEFLVLPRIAAELPGTTVDPSTWKMPSDIRLADPKFCNRGPVDMLLGADTFVEVVRASKLKLGPELPTLIDTELGWIVSGTYIQRNTGQAVACSAVEQRDEPNIGSLISKFFDIEEVVDQNPWSSEEQECEDHYKATTGRDVDGRYVVRLPFKSDRELGESKKISLRRFKKLERRFEIEPKLKEAYNGFMDEYIKLGHMSATLNSESAEGYYMPHHAVFKDSSTTKCRVVFDGSCKTSNGRSLNSVLKVGPTIQQDVTDILLRWRRRIVGVVGDVEKMYRQVWVHMDDRKYQRVLWRSHPGELIRTYELNTITYGTASAPFLAIRTLNQVLEDYKVDYPVAAAHVKDFYVDDFISGADSEHEAQKLCRETKAALALGGFPLRKWASNCPHILPTEADSVRQVVELRSEEETLPTLGLAWSPKIDTLGVRLSKIETNQLYTKRRIIGAIAKIYDPLGIVDTVKAKAKQFMQRVWTLKKQNGDSYGWDEEIPHRMKCEWEEFESQLGLLQEIRVPRCVIIRDASNIQLHGFCDASEDGYGACVYARSANKDKVVSRLYVSKSKVTPLATKHTIARLELCAAHLLGKLIQKIKRATREEFEIFCWTDSSTVMYWVKSSPSRWKTFVANRISKIQKATKGCEWRHVPGIENPADAVSRGRNPKEAVVDLLWWHGPDWLLKSQKYWPNLPEIGKTGEVVAEETPDKLALNCVAAEPSFITRRIVAYCYRFIDHKGMNRRAYVELSELRRAENTILRLVQGEHFVRELESIKQGQQMMRASPLRSMQPILDENNVMRRGGRLSNADIGEDQKHPVIIPGKHRLAVLIAERYHKILHHAGLQLLINTIQQRYWILGIRQIVKRILFNCVKCTRCRPVFIRQPMADLPQQRVRQARPFAISGVDYAGPVFLKGTHRRAVPTKGYISIFVCFVTKAVHIELVSNLTSAAFLAALRRFVARRGKVAELHSDNGTNFRGANNKLRELYKLLHSETHNEEVIGWCGEQDIKWTFTPPAAPHFGGLWEAAVKSMKFHLKRVLGTGHLSFEDLSTLLSEIEAMLNSRPITALSDDPNDMEALTPGHFLVGSNILTVPDIDIAGIPSNRLNHWRLMQKHIQHLWKRWHREYLGTLQRRAKWVKNPVSIAPGRLVILQEDNLAVCRWPMARITEIHPGRDGVVRVVSLKCNGKEIRRPVHKVAPLPVE